MNKIFAAASATLLFISCSSKQQGSNDATAADTVATDSTEVIIDSAATDSVDVQAADTMTDPVVEFDNDSQAKATDKPLVIDFSATWCGPCQQFKPVFHKVAAEYAAKATFASADVDVCTNLARKYGIRSIPYILIINPDGTTAFFEGKMSESEFKEFLGKNLK